MSYGEIESSVDSGEPVLLFEFRYGELDSHAYRYTDAEEDLDFLGKTYTAVPIECGEITASGTLDKATLTVNIFEGSGLTDIFRFRPPSSIVTLIVRHGHIGDDSEQFLVGWTGRVIGFSIEGNQTQLNCEPLGTSLKRNGLRRNWQYGCPHLLYGPQCGASKAAASSQHAVLAVSGGTITLAANWDSDARRPKYAGGLAQWTLPDGRVELRTILRIDAAGVVRLTGSASDLDPGDFVTMTLGCNHKAGVGPQPDGDCLPLHNAIQNFGGQMFIPFKNPIGITNNYY
jgi:hypothetical protein